ncbi:AbiV family abortive infection protein [Phenylobacterium sp.]|uniref:AbiV family abortive infection protein n=1 Tax=Phenylobacterium sp. TaxID=1871053 RepID=UPI003BA958BF
MAQIYQTCAKPQEHLANILLLSPEQKGYGDETTPVVCTWPVVRFSSRGDPNSMAGPLNPYTGALELPEVAEGMAAAATNAARLLADAELLFEHERYPAAASLAILSIEERGKIQILKEFAILPDDHWTKTWRAYRNHRHKNVGWILFDLVRRGARKLGELSQAVDPKGDHTATLDAVKQIAIYSDCFGARHWSLPAEVIGRETAASMLAVARSMWPARTMSVRELELWREHVRPHYGTLGMSGAMIRLQTALYAEGLTTTTPEELGAFMVGV